ncbi:unnamed protein product [Moneuplotes crassus]|uniref:dolichol kinase n=1 Tax=Euplotes crassus TaxID=5936 RepID=A0AAD1UA67_EUPCR|nr:unnamed protein product [Moneuplotes crassus]
MLTHRIDDNIAVELSDMNPKPKKYERQIDYGIVECLIPIFFCLSFVTFTNNSEYFVGSTIAFVFLYSKFHDWIPNSLRNTFLAALCGSILYFSNGQYYQCVSMTLMVYIPFHTLLKEYSGSFNFIDIFGLLVLNCIFLVFWTEKLFEFCQFWSESQNGMNKYEFLSKIRPKTIGYIPEILLFFCPYVILNISGGLFTLSLCMTGRRTEKYCLSFVIVSTMILLCIMIAANRVSPFEFDIIDFLISEATKVFTSGVFWYMFTSLPFCLIMISSLPGDNIFATRKFFHFTALALFLPAVVANQKIMVFGSNLAIVCFVMIEFTKKYNQGAVLKLIHHYEEKYLDEREMNRDGVILSHLFLLLGATIPTITSYILVDGMEFPSHFILFSLSGLVFVGIGDSMAALCGKIYGKTKWPGRSKSQEGSFFCIFSYMLFYVIILMLTTPLVTSGKGIEIFIAGFVATMVEAFTRQFDNFLSPQICFASVLFMSYYFEEYLPNL